MNFENWLRAKVVARGGIPFEQWMVHALYHPQGGYYAKGDRPRTGRKGDFFTNVSVGPIFGASLACQFVQMWELLDRPADFTLIEQGAMDAQLALDILAALRETAPELREIVRYRIVEFLPANLEKQKAAFRQAGFDRVDWEEHLSDIDVRPCTGVFYSNELVDSFPVHLISYRKGFWTEAYVVAAPNDKLAFEYRQIFSGPLAREIARLKIPDIDGYTTEINLAASRWMKEAAAALKRGFVVTIDYGYPGETYYHPDRREGTLQTYREHRKGGNPLASPGEQDMTAHVNFSELAAVGTQAGLTLEGFTDQHHFLAGLTPFLFHEDNPAPPATLRQWKTLAHPEMLGTRFQYLIQSKGVSLASPIHGLRFTRAAGL